jgi:hypothetical protein
LAGKSKTPNAGFAQFMRMSNLNPNCDGSHCRHGYKEVRQYPLASSPGSGDRALYLCLPCFANENMSRHHRATGRPEAWPQVSWATAEGVYDKHGEPFDPEAAVRQGIIKYHQNGDDNGNE